MDNNINSNQELEDVRRELEEMFAQGSNNEDEPKYLGPKFGEEEYKLFNKLSERMRELKIGEGNWFCENGSRNIANTYTSLPDELKEEILHHVIAYRDGRRIKFRGRNQCILRYLAHEYDYPSEIRDEILNCIYKLQSNSRILNSDNRIIVEGVLEGLVNYNWFSCGKVFTKNVKEIKNAMHEIVGQENAVEQLLKCYNILAHTHKAGPHVIRIRADAGMGVDTLVKTFAGAIGRYCEISCQNLGIDPETTAGSSRVYCNSTPGELGEAIINNEVNTIILKNINDADERNIARLSAFFENTFVDNYYRVRVPGDVLVICTESKSEKKTPEYLYRDAYTIELTDYSVDECKVIANNMIAKLNNEFGLELSFEDAALEMVITQKSPKEIYKMLLDVFSDISFKNEMSPEDGITKKIITVEDLN